MIAPITYLKKGLLLLLFIPVSVVVQAQYPLSLADAIKTGLENNFQIRIAQQNYEIAVLTNTQGAAGRWPSITLGLNNANKTL